ncbi:hypothetical protein GQ457_06G027330 [Hibiscus cannabinus]
MAVSRGMMAFCFITLVVCCSLVKSSNAGPDKVEGCRHQGQDHHGHENQQCQDTPEDEDDFDDTFKIVDNVKITI